MSATKRVRWECPNGCPGVLGPSRPRKDNIVRYCLDCSKREGKLVERIAPTLEKQRARAKEKSQLKASTKAARARAREREKKYIQLSDARDRVVEIDPIAATQEIARRAGYKRAPYVPVTWRRGNHSYVTGRANEYGITMTIGKDASLERFVNIALHEAAHAEAGGAAGHGQKWRETYAAGAKELLGVVFYMPSIKHRYDDMDPHVREGARDISRKRKKPIVGRTIYELPADMPVAAGGGA